MYTGLPILIYPLCHLPERITPVHSMSNPDRNQAPLFEGGERSVPKVAKKDIAYASRLLDNLSRQKAYMEGA